jgi:lipoate-protein ligase A
MQRWRTMDGGLAPIRQHLALTRTILEARARNEVPATLRFFRAPPTVIIGSNECADQVTTLAEISNADVGLVRGLTVQQAHYVDPLHLGWELHLASSDVEGGLRRAFRRTCEATAAGLAAMGADVCLSKFMDIRSRERIVCMMTALTDGDVGVIQGWICLRRDVARIRAFLRGPPADMGDDSHVNARMTDIESLLGRRPDARSVRRVIIEALETEFDVEFAEDELTLAEDRRHRPALKSMDTPDWTGLIRGAPDGMPVVTARVRLGANDVRLVTMFDRASGVVRSACFDSDDATLRDNLIPIESALADVSVARIERRLGLLVPDALSRIGVSASAVSEAMQRVLGQPSLPPG